MVISTNLGSETGTYFLKKNQENVFYDIVERKNASLCYKNKELKQAKN